MRMLQLAANGRFSSNRGPFGSPRDTHTRVRAQYQRDVPVRTQKAFARGHGSAGDRIARQVAAARPRQGRASCYSCPSSQLPNRARNLSIACPRIWQTRDSLTPSTAPISRRFSSSS